MSVNSGSDPIQVVGGGLAGSECAFQLAERGLDVILWEMRPKISTPAHQSDAFAELVCSNSLRSDDPYHAAGLLKREMEAFGSLVIAAARECAVPAGSALAVDRHAFSQRITMTLASHPRIEIRRQEIEQLPAGDAVLATGPLTSDALSQALAAELGAQHLYFYDAIAPIVEAESLDYRLLFWASRYGKGGGDDYLNAPLNRQEYLDFHQAVCAAEVVELHDFEQNLFFEGCLPIEEIARRGVDTLRFGTMKPVGLTCPDGSKPYAVVQLRREDLSRHLLNMVGFQSRMTWTEQKRVLRMIPGLAKARFTRLGQVHRNTFINAPSHLDRLYRLRSRPEIRLAGQLTGVEGYLESAATGLATALYISLDRSGRYCEALPETSALGALARHLTESAAKRFQPANINFGLFPELEVRRGKKLRRQAFVSRAQADLAAWAERLDLPFHPPLSPPSPPG